MILGCVCDLSISMTRVARNLFTLSVSLHLIYMDELVPYGCKPRSLASLFPALVTENSRFTSRNCPFGPLYAELRGHERVDTRVFELTMINLFSNCSSSGNAVARRADSI